MFPLAIPLISLVGGLLSSVVGSVVSKEMSEASQANQARINQQGIDTANRYNLPINQMNRLREAGLNPNLVYGNGTVAGLTSSGQASTNQGLKNVPFDLGVKDAVGSYLESKQLEQSVSESQSRQELLAQQVRESMAKEMMYTKSALKDDAELPYIQEYWKKRIYELGTRGELNAATRDLHTIERASAVELANLYAARTNLTQEQASTEIKRRFVMDAQAALYRSNVQVNEKELEWLAEKILNTKQDTANKELWHRIQEAEFNSTGALKQYLSDHSNWAIFYAILKDIFKSGVVSPW